MQEENIITDVTEISKGRYKVELDGEFEFPLYKNELHTYHIQTGEGISGKILEEIMTEILPRRAKLCSMNLLKSRPYTECQIREKLKQGFYPEEVIDKAVAYIKSFHYIDDRCYAKNYIVYYSESRSRGRITQDLMRKGVAKELINAVYEEDLEDELPDETVLMERWIQKRNYDREHADYRERQKMAAFLYRKGFSLDKIEKSI